MGDPVDELLHLLDALGREGARGLLANVLLEVATRGHNAEPDDAHLLDMPLVVRGAVRAVLDERSLAAGNLVRGGLLDEPEGYDGPA